jgi:hypothetical protein
MNLRATANPAKPMDIKSAELPASGAVTGGGGAANKLPVTITRASITKPRDNFDFCIFSFLLLLFFANIFHTAFKQFAVVTEVFGVSFYHPQTTGQLIPNPVITKTEPHSNRLHIFKFQTLQSSSHAITENLFKSGQIVVVMTFTLAYYEIHQ